MSLLIRCCLLVMLSGTGLGLAVGLNPMSAHAADRAIDFNRDIRPILSEHCFACHGFDEKARKAGLRLDQSESAYAEHATGTPLKPGDLEASELWQRVISDDPATVMPPPKSHSTLTDAEKAKLKQWIEAGAQYAGHWAFLAPKRVVVPEGATQPIDAFVRVRLTEEGLVPSPEADRAMLARRLSLDLTGLPPTSTEVDAFVADTGPNAYEQFVDRLLASPHFGERMALDWLDAARYADTNGYSIDGGRQMWLWRDWVIQAFNDNKRYDRFLLEQLAGDLLPTSDDATLIATGFQRNNMVTHEGGTIPEENLTNYNADRIKTLGEAILGLTLGCAQCHDHKFDPITQRDYYQLFAFFNTLDDIGLDGNFGINPRPQVNLRTVLRTGERDELTQRIAALEQQLAAPDANLLAAWETRQQSRLAARGKEFALHPVKALNVSTPNRGAGFEIEGEAGVRLKNVGDYSAFDVTLKLPTDVGPIRGVRVSFIPSDDLPGGGWGYGPNTKRRKGDVETTEPEKGSFVLTAIGMTADVIPSDQVNLHRLEQIDHVTANSWLPAHPPQHVLDLRNENGWSPDLATTGPVHLTATLVEPIDSAKTPYLTFQVGFGYGQNMVPNLFQIAVFTGNDDDSDLPAPVIAALAVPAETRTPEQIAVIRAEFANSSDELAAVRIELANLKDRLAHLTQAYPTMVMNVSAKPRETRILNRGDYAQPGETVKPGTIAALPPLPPGAGSDRLALARWLVMRENPLTARVAVNRFWKQLFGTGLVATAADFGMQGEWPSHPELLDWLAIEFMDSAWDTKRLIKTIVLSETYRQTSFASPELLDRDPQNRLLARGPRFRLPAELVRDAALRTSGLLVDRIGGPSVTPYMPGDLWREVSHFGSTPATAQTFVQDHGEKLYRRSLYTFWKRTAPPPNMTTFDAPNREVCTISRGNTTTPLQALVTLNDPQFVEAARAFAERIVAQPGTDHEKLAWAVREATSRPAEQRELEILSAAVLRERARYTADPAKATALLAIGESPRNPAIPAPEHAAWTQIASLLLNLSESVTRN
jgi:hypothetical protein